NNQETNRGSVDAQLDERTLREIYLKPFERAIIEGGAMSVMPAYNKVNGDYCSENGHLLNEILRGEWGFKGFTVSDWGGTHSTMGAMLHGLNVQMTGDNYLGQPVIDSIKAGKLTEDLVDEKVRQILRVRMAIEAVPANVANTVQTSQPESQNIAREVAEKSIVLLKNEGNLLPISKDVKSIAVIGQNAVLKTQSGGMGAGVKALYEITPLEGIRKRAGEGVEVSYAPGYKTIAFRWGPAPEVLDPLEARSNDEPADPFLVSEACEAAANADLVIFFGGTNKSIETEGSDRKNIDLPCGQNELVKALKQVNPNLVTVLISGGPTDLRELEPVSPAIVQGWWNGTEGGTALAEVLFGDIAPSGKLPFTFPKKLEDSPAYAMGNFPDPDGAGGDLFSLMFRPDVLKMSPEERQQFLASLPKPVSKYTERFYVGYRWFDTKEIAPMYAFGHGLSYVNFDYDDLTAKVGKDAIKVTVKVENEGSMPADEVVQVYVNRPESKVEWPVKELKAFQRVSLNAGETKTVTLEIPLKDLRYWNEADNAWTLENGKLLLLVGSASDDIRETTEVTI
ncbi:MAG: glycoside hydrolase family 3 C-terminal domain-containing protein, partial [Bacteroidales bacterium]|nr:glycoside hydrolase family 3 C-terminal domain-containing protein [Bacteroidales bacterium]